MSRQLLVCCRMAVVAFSASALVLAVGFLPTEQAEATHQYDNVFPTPQYMNNCRDSTLGDPMGFCQTDNVGLTVWREGSLSSSGRLNIGQMLDDQYRDLTKLTVTFVQQPSYSGDSETDIIYQHGDGLPGSLDGLTWCNDSESNVQCDQHYNRFRMDNPKRDLACHETGHGVGLTHGEEAEPFLRNDANIQGCMQQPLPLSNEGRLGSLNIHNINDTDYDL